MGLNSVLLTGRRDMRLENLSLIGLAMLTLLVAILAGLQSMGWSLPLPERLAYSHGLLMVAGFFGTLIGLERAFAMGRGWGYLAPIFAGLGALATIAGLDGGGLLLVLGSLVLAAIFIAILRFQFNLSTATMGLGAACLLGGNMLWLALGVKAATPYWGAFLLLTVAGERLELAQLLRSAGGVRATFLLAMALYLAGVVATSFAYSTGMRLSGLGMLALFAWLLRHDAAMKSLRKEGLPKFIALCLVLGYLWLGVSGALGAVYAGSHAYDAMLHALMLGFVFSMVFGHAPIIFPALLEVEMPFLRGFYIHLALLHLSLLLRLGGSFAPGLLMWGGLLSGTALILFLMNNFRAILSSPPHQHNP